MKALLKHPLFMIGFSFIVLLLWASLVHFFFFDSYVPVLTQKFDESNKMVGVAPFPPAEYPPFGTNYLGESLFFKVLKGAKFTIGLAVVVAFFRLVISIVIGILYGNYLMKVNRFLSKIIESFHYVPMALLAYILLEPVLTDHIGGFEFSFNERVLFEIIVLTIIALPTTTLLIGNETNLILRQDFITGVKLMEGSRLYILRKHVMPHLMPRLWIQLAQQVIQVLVLLIHLGVLRIFFGGTLEHKVATGGAVYNSVSGEWSGILERKILQISAAPWLSLTSLVMFALTILAMHFIVEGLKDVLGQDQVHKVHRKKLKREKSAPIDQHAFELVEPGNKTTHHG